MRAAFAFLFAITIMACASAHKEEAAKPAEEPAKVEGTTPPPVPEAAAAPEATPDAKQVTAALQPPAPTEAPKQVEFNGIAPDKSLGWLKNGNTRYLKGYLRKDGQSKADIARVTEGQKPHAVIISCSDSRVPPELVFDQKLGEVVVVRTAAETLDHGAIGAVENAIEQLGVRLVVVLGHNSCGFVNAAIKTLNGGDAGSPALNGVLADIRPRIKSSFAKETRDDGAGQSLANAKGVAADLLTRSPKIKAAVENGQVTIKSALYTMETGAVSFE